MLRPKRSETGIPLHFLNGTHRCKSFVSFVSFIFSCKSSNSCMERPLLALFTEFLSYKNSSSTISRKCDHCPPKATDESRICTVGQWVCHTVSESVIRVNKPSFTFFFIWAPSGFDFLAIGGLLLILTGFAADALNSGSLSLSDELDESLSKSCSTAFTYLTMQQLQSPMQEKSSRQLNSVWRDLFIIIQ